MLFPIYIKHNLHWHMAKGSRKSAEVTEGMEEGLAKDTVGLMRVEREKWDYCQMYKLWPMCSV